MQCFHAGWDHHRNLTPQFEIQMHDVQATVLHLLGIAHERLTDKFQGRCFRLTDVHGRVINEILA
ncbi:MAG: DUF1501 domain-containing protein [Planctomycetaceae bacterium]